MEDVRGYRFGAALFGLAAVISAVAVAYGSYCCAAFSVEDQAILTSLGAPDRRGVQWLTAALLDWPLGFRLSLMILTTAIFGFAVALCELIFFSKNDKFARLSKIFRPPSAALLVGSIYILIIYIAGFFGYKGPLILIAWLGAAVLVSLMYFPNRNGLILAIPLAIVGFGAAAIISMVMGIGWD